MVLPDFAHDFNGSAKVLNDAVVEMLPGVEVQLVQRRHFDEEKGAELVRSLVVDAASNLSINTFKKYVLSCLSVHCSSFRTMMLASAFALIKYVELIQGIIFSAKSVRFRFEQIEDSCLIGTAAAAAGVVPFSDVISWENLDLYQRRSSKKKRAVRTLFDRLNSCVTDGGRRTLCSLLLQPSLDPMESMERLDAVEELMAESAVCSPTL